jgi:hypothetical protein
VARLFAAEPFFSAIYYIVAGVIGSLAVVYLLAALRWRGEAFSFSAKKIESYDAALFAVVFSYIFPFIAKAGEITVGAVVALGLGAWAFFWFTDAPVTSPLLRVMGYRFYKAESATGMVYTLITRREILDPGDVKTVKRISGAMLLEVIA